MDHYFTNNKDLKSEIKQLNYSYGKNDYAFFSDNGVFSKGKIDYGSKLLVETFIKNSNKRGDFLDIGCGYGFIGLVLKKELDINITMADINKRAIHLAKMNAEKLKITSNIFESNIYENIKQKYDVIITNPPVRAGKETLLKFLIGAKDHLKKDGELWYVLRKDQGAKSVEKLLNEHFNVENVEKSNGFYIFSAKSIDNL